VHSAVDICQVSRQEAHLFQKAGSGLRQRAQSGSSSVPAFSGAPVPQREQAAHRLRHRLQTEAPVAREIPILLSAADPRMLQARSGPGRQLWQTGPAPVTAATRRSCPHFAQGFQPRGSRRQQFWQCLDADESQLVGQAEQQGDGSLGEPAPTVAGQDPVADIGPAVSGNSQVEEPSSPRLAWPRRVASSCRARTPTGVGFALAAAEPPMGITSACVMSSRGSAYPNASR
jgi:hypothetical protein